MNRQHVLEAVLFAAGEPVAISELTGLLDLSKAELTQELETLQAAYADRGIRLVFDNKTAQLVTAPEMGDYLARYLQSELRGKLSPAALETLAIIAYKGPVTRPEIEQIRGVQSAQPVRTLAIRGLITEVGRKKEPGRPMLFDTTIELYKHLGISGRDELPQLPAEIVEKLQALPQAETGAAADPSRSS